MKKNTAIGIAAVAVAGAFTIGLGAVSSWFTNWNVKTWFGRGGGNATVQPENPNIPDYVGQDNAVISNGESNGIKLMSAILPRSAYVANGVSAQADTAYTLTATLSPTEVTDNRVVYSAEWVNAESDWATDKAVSDYVTVTQKDYGLTATVECKQAFGEQVIITCYAFGDETVNATCTVDYRVRILEDSFIGYYVAGAGDQSINFNSSNASGGAAIGNIYIGSITSFSSHITESIGTLRDDMTCTVTFTPTSDIMRLLPNATAKSRTINVKNNAITNLDSAFVESLFGSGVYGTAAFYNACSGTMSSTAIKVDVEYVGENTDYSYTYYLRIDYRSVKVAANNVTLDKDNIIF